MRKFNRRLITALLVVASILIHLTPIARAQSMTLNSEQQLLREIFQELIEINTVDPEGNVTQAAEAMAARLRAAGFAAEDARVLVPAANAKKGNLVARYRSPKATGQTVCSCSRTSMSSQRAKRIGQADLTRSSSPSATAIITGAARWTIKRWPRSSSPTSSASNAKTTSLSATSSWRSPPTKNQATSTASSFCSESIARSSMRSSGSMKAGAAISRAACRS
jgi:hypothetical protein